jgi:hypothetical protein
VDELGRAAGGADGVVLALDQRDAVAARRRVEGHPGAGDPAPDDDDVEAIGLESRQCLVARDHGRYVT